MTPKLGEVRVESGSWDSIRPFQGVALVAHWSDRLTVSRSTSTLLAELDGAGYGTVLVSSCELEGPLEIPSGIADLVLRRPNIGYDFGSWAAAMGSGSHLLRSRNVVLANDSLVGPFESIHHVLRHADESPAHVWGLVASGQFGWHLQSYFLRFAPGVLADPAVSRFWASVRDLGTKDRVIHRYELGLSRMLHAEGFRLDSYIPVGMACPADRNPMIVGWKAVMAAGLPFVKRELIRHPEVAEDGKDVAAHVAARYAIDIAEWM